MKCLKINIEVAQPLVIYEMYGLIVYMYITSLHILYLSLYGCIM